MFIIINAFIFRTENNMATRFRKLAVGGLAGTVGAGLACYLLLKENGNGSVSILY